MMLKILLSIFFTTYVFAQTSIYKVSNNESEVYLFATINLLRNNDYPLDEKYDSIYQQLDTLYFETDYNALIEQKTYNYFLNQLKYQNNKTLQQNLEKSAYFKLSNISRNYGLKIKEYQKHNVTLLLSMLEFTIRFNHAGVNAELAQYYLNKALKDQKEVKYLSSIYAYLNHSNLKHVNTLEQLTPYLNRLDYMDRYYNDIIQSWKEGKLEEIDSIFYIYGNASYLHEKWLGVISKELQTNKKTGIFLHASAFSDEFNLVQKLQSLGFNVEQL